MAPDSQLLIWLISAGIYLLASVGLVPFVAIEKDRSGIGWAIASLLFSPLLALIALAAVPPGTAHDRPALSRRSFGAAEVIACVL